MTRGVAINHPEKDSGLRLTKSEQGWHSESGEWCTRSSGKAKEMRLFR